MKRTYHSTAHTAAPSRIRFAVGFLIQLLAVFFALPVAAGSDHYDYDPLGRLVRWVDASGNVTEYRYDAIGNLLAVQQVPGANGPAAGTPEPSLIRRGESRAIRIPGMALSGVRVSTPDPVLVIDELKVQDDAVSFRLDVTDVAPLGPQTFSLSNALGTANVDLTIAPRLPQLRLLPIPVSIPPDGSSRTLSVTLSNPDIFPHTLRFMLGDPTLAVLTPDTATIPPGQQTVRLAIAGKRIGASALTVSADGLESLSVPVLVTPDFLGVGTSRAAQVGVLKPGPTTEPKPSFGMLAASPVGLVRSAAIAAVTPSVVARGGVAELRISGWNLQQVDRVLIQPGDGIVVGQPSIEADGGSLTLAVSVDEAAALGARRVVLSAQSQTIAPVQVGADRFEIADTPRIDSVDPLTVKSGETTVLRIRGEGFRPYSRVRVVPDDAIAVSSAPQLSADCEVLSVPIAVSAFAASGPRAVVVDNLGMYSDTTPNVSNTLTIVDPGSSKQTFGPFVSASLQVVRAVEPVRSVRSAAVRAAELGVIRGATIVAVQPSTAVVGTRVALVLAGVGLDGVDRIEFKPATGLQVSNLQPSDDGRTLRAELAIAPDAPLTIRELRAYQGTQALPVRADVDARLAVVAPVPEIQAIEPNYVVAGEAPVTVRLRGRYFQGASFVRVVPGDDMVVSWPPAIDALGQSLTVRLNAAAGAAAGPRTVVVESPAGGSGALGTGANTVTVLSKPPALRDLLLNAAAVGVTRPLPPLPTPRRAIELSAPNLGVMRGAAVPTPPSVRPLEAHPLGVVSGPVVTAMQVPYLGASVQGEILIYGVGLTAVQSAQLIGAAGVTFGNGVATADGTVFRLPFEVSNVAPMGGRRLRLIDSVGRAIPFLASVSPEISILPAPHIDSISPLFGRPGQIIDLIVSGANLSRGRLRVEPADGLLLEPAVTINAAGTELRARLAIAPDAELGGRVVRLEAPGGLTGQEPTPANTFTLYPP